MANQTQRFFPPNTPENRHLRFAFEQLYALHDEHQKTKEALAASQAQVKTLTEKLSGPFPPGTGPSDSVMLGIPVLAVDSSALADGTKLTFDKAQGRLVFK